MDSAELQKIILNAFRCVPRPRAAEIAPHRCPECDELAADFAAHLPSAIPDDVFQRHVGDMPLLSADAKHYYLPAWLLRCLKVDGPWLPEEASMVLYALEGDHRWDPTTPYTQEQWRALRLWIDHVAQFADSIDGEHLEKVRRRVDNEL